MGNLPGPSLGDPKQILLQGMALQCLKAEGAWLLLSFLIGAITVTRMDANHGGAGWVGGGPRGKSLQENGSTGGPGSWGVEPALGPGRWKQKSPQ